MLRLSAYRDAGGIWTICRGVTRIEGAPVRQGLRLTAQQCDDLNQIEAQRAIDWVKRNVKVPLAQPQIAGIASFCPYNIGPVQHWPRKMFFFFHVLPETQRRGHKRRVCRNQTLDEREKTYSTINRPHSTSRAY